MDLNISLDQGQLLNLKRVMVEEKGYSHADTFDDDKLELVATNVLIECLYEKVKKLDYEEKIHDSNYLD